MSRLLSAVLLAALALGNALAAGTGVTDQYRVNLRVFFRAFCPACQWFVGDPLLELVRSEAFRNIIDLKLIPAAGMTEKDGVMECESGPVECTGHRWQACVIDKDRDDVVKYLGSIACIEGDESGRVGDWNTKIQNCLTEEERVVVKDCFNTRSKDLLLEMIRKDRSGSVAWMPYTIVDDKVLGTATEGVGLVTLKGNICQAYKGPREAYPEECVKLVGPQKNFPPEDVVVAAQVIPLEKPDPKVDAGEQPAAANGELELDIKEETAADVEAPGVATGGKTRLEMYWRAFCPGCMSFITKPLLKLIREESFQKIIDFVPVPAAGTSIDADGNFVCVKGLVECMGHRWLSCVIEEVPEIGPQIESLACLESSDNKGLTWSFIVNKCFTGDALTRMKTCYDTKSEDLLRKHVAAREKVYAPWVPYVIINGKPIGDASHGITLKYLAESVCQGYTGPAELLPSVCQPKRLRDADPIEEANDEPVVKPCPPKKDGKKSVLYDDAPGIGKRVAREDNTVTELEANVLGGKQSKGSFSSHSLLMPGLCFVVVAILVLRFSGDHKKDA